MWGSIIGIFTSGFGIRTVWKLVSMARKAKAARKEFYEAYVVGGQLIAELKNMRALSKKVWSDNKVDPDEAKQLAKQSYAIAKEVEEFYVEMLDVINIFE